MERMAQGTVPMRPPFAASAEAEAVRGRAAPEAPPDDTATRFREIVHAAVDLANAAHFQRAALLLGLAERWRTESALTPARERAIRDRLSEALDEEQLVRGARLPEGREPVAAVLEFFPRFACERLVATLRHEPRGERRHVLLALLEARGRVARDLAVARLKAPVGDASGSDDWYLRRNLLHLLRRIPAPPEAPITESLDIAVRHSRLGLPAIVVKEAVALLGQTRDDRAEYVLIRLLDEVTDMLPVRDAYGETEGLASVGERIAAALASFPTGRARRAILDHGERLRATKRPMIAIAALGHQDLSDDEATVDRLLGLVRRIRRGRVLGRIVPFLRDRDEDDLVPALEALAGTPLPVVRRALRLVARRFENQLSGRTAARILRDLESRTASG